MWSGGLPLQIQPNIGWEALGSLEAYWSELIETTLAEGVKGSTYAATLVDAGLVLEASKNIRGFAYTLKRLKSGETSAFRELVVVALLNKAGLPVELEPTLGSRRLDASFTYSYQTVFVEVITPNSSEFHKRVNETMYALAWYLYQRGRRNMITISLLDEPNPDLLGQMVTIDEQVDANPLYDVPYSFENRIEWIYSKPSFPTNIVPSRQRGSNPPNSMLSFANPTNGAHINVEFLLDEPKRLGKLIDKEIKHFARETTNLLIIDTKNNSLDPKDKAQVVRRRLQPDINRRLSGILLLSEFYTVNGIKVQREWELISNPYAYNPLSNPLQEFLSQLGSYQLW